MSRAEALGVPQSENASTANITDLITILIYSTFVLVSLIAIGISSNSSHLKRFVLSLCEPQDWFPKEIHALNQLWCSE